MNTPTLEDVAMRVLPPLTVLRSANGILSDNCNISVACPRGHVHNYAIVDALKGLSKCKTCTQGTVFSKMVLREMETIFATPFKLGISYQEGCFEYVSVKYGMRFACHKISGGSGKPVVDEHGITFIFYKTNSLTKLRTSLIAQAVAVREHMKNAWQFIEPLTKTTHDRRRYEKQPIPFSPALAISVFGKDSVQYAQACEHTKRLGLENC